MIYCTHRTPKVKFDPTGGPSYCEKCGGELNRPMLRPGTPPWVEHGSFDERPRIAWPLWLVTILFVLLTLIWVIASVSPLSIGPVGGRTTPTPFPPVDGPGVVPWTYAPEGSTDARPIDLDRICGGYPGCSSKSAGS